MPKRKTPKPFPWRNSQQLRGVRSQLVVAINTSEDGAYAQVDLKTARNLLEICDQAIQTEVGHEPIIHKMMDFTDALRKFADILRKESVK